MADHRNVLAALQTILLLLGAAGCGGSAGPTKQEYVEDVNTICAGARSSKGTAPPSPDRQRLADDIEREILAARSLLERITAVKPPADDAEQVRSRFLEPTRARVRLLEDTLPELRQALERQDLDRLTRVTERLRPDPEVRAFTSRYGLTTCTGFGPF